MSSARRMEMGLLGFRKKIGGMFLPFSELILNFSFNVFFEP